MIADALNFITNQLDGFLKSKMSVTEPLVKLSGLVTAAGTFSLNDENILAVTVVNIAEENSITNQTQFERQAGSMIKKAPPVYINIYLLISAVFTEKQYADGLDRLSLAISFFQQNPYFTSEQIAMPTCIDKLSFELVNLDLAQMSSFWGALGARYQPSVIYKVRMLKFSSEMIEAAMPEIIDRNVTLK